MNTSFQARLAALAAAAVTTFACPVAVSGYALPEAPATAQLASAAAPVVR